MSFLSILVVILIIIKKNRPVFDDNGRQIAKFKKWKVAELYWHPAIMINKKTRHLKKKSKRAEENHKYCNKRIDSVKLHNFNLKKDNDGNAYKYYIRLHDNPNPKNDNPGMIYKKVSSKSKNSYYDNPEYKKWKVSKENKKIISRQYKEYKDGVKLQEQQKNKNKEKKKQSNQR